MQGEWAEEKLKSNHFLVLQQFFLIHLHTLCEGTGEMTTNL